ncbi:MAG: hypothetical protein KGM99_17055 [Burkholderiales bacterium]|nr:hypothetical protein [Burkholderiales bacterium]
MHKTITLTGILFRYHALLFNRMESGMVAHIFPETKRIFIATGLAVLLCSQAHAVDLWEFRALDVVPILSSYIETANLSANQKNLWQQMESKTKAILRVREERHAEIQTSIKNRLQEKAPELRDMALLLDQDDTLSAQENKDLREYWMTFYDALTDAQRDAMAVLLKDQMSRVADKPREARPGSESRGQGSRRGNKGGMGGMGGMGSGGRGGEEN